MYEKIPKDSIIIRKFQPADLPEVIQIDKEASGGHHPFYLTDFYENYSETFLVALESERVVGFILGFKTSPMVGRIFWLAVVPDRRNLGIGRSLMTAMLRLFCKLGAIGVTLEVKISNKRAQSLYTSAGFQMLAICPNYYYDGEAAIVMRKLLTPPRHQSRPLAVILNSAVEPSG